jgi:hypothetical protein
MIVHGLQPSDGAIHCIFMVASHYYQNVYNFPSPLNKKSSNDTHPSLEFPSACPPLQSVYANDIRSNTLRARRLRRRNDRALARMRVLESGDKQR